jgi:hypothetical protein
VDTSPQEDHRSHGSGVDAALNVFAGLDVDRTPIVDLDDRDAGGIRQRAAPKHGANGKLPLGITGHEQTIG